MAKKRNFDKEINSLLFSTFAILILLLSIFNLQNINKKRIKTVLGAQSENLYWEDFLVKHPSYIQGWLELKRFDKIEEIDPSYFK